MALLDIHSKWSYWSTGGYFQVFAICVYIFGTLKQYFLSSISVFFATVSEQERLLKANYSKEEWSESAKESYTEPMKILHFESWRHLIWHDVAQLLETKKNATHYIL